MTSRDPKGQVVTSIRLVPISRTAGDGV